jgi:hypothetical protein
MRQARRKFFTKGGLSRETVDLFPDEDRPTLGSFFEPLKNNRPDPEYARDLEEIQADQQPIGNYPWAC